jgi:hypothetical protein
MKKDILSDEQRRLPCRWGRKEEKNNRSKEMGFFICISNGIV